MAARTLSVGVDSLGPARTVVAVSIAESYGQQAGARLIHPGGHLLDLPVVYFCASCRWLCAQFRTSMEQIDGSVPEAAGSLGAGWWQAFRRVTLPLVWPGQLPARCWRLSLQWAICGVSAGLCTQQPAGVDRHRVGVA
jgi:hypothetical protein